MARSSILILITGASGSGKTMHYIFNLIKEREKDGLIDKIYLYAKNLNKPKKLFSVKKPESVRIKHLNVQKHL